MSKAYLKKILVKSDEKNIFISAQDINWIESSGNYVIIYLPGNSYMIRGSLKKMEKKLDPTKFIRIHCSTIVNIDKIKLIERWFSGDFKVVLKNGEKIKMNRNLSYFLRIVRKAALP